MNEFDRRDLGVALRYDLASFIQRTFQTVVPAADYQDNWHIDATSGGRSVSVRQKLSPATDTQHCIPAIAC